MFTLNQFIPDEESLMRLASVMAKGAAMGTVIFLQGPLGAGKTTFSRGFLQGLGHDGIVKSPTYTLVEPYETSKGHVFHFDFYRLKDPEELEFIGIEEYVSPKAICLMEWPEMAGNLLPKADISCYIEPYETGRKIKITAFTERGTTLLKQLIAATDEH